MTQYLFRVNSRNKSNFQGQISTILSNQSQHNVTGVSRTSMWKQTLKIRNLQEFKGLWEFRELKEFAGV